MEKKSSLKSQPTPTFLSFSRNIGCRVGRCRRVDDKSARLHFFCQGLFENFPTTLEYQTPNSLFLSLLKTLDGSHTVFVAELNEHYHSVNGAVSESMHVYIQNGLEFMKAKTKRLNILEVGMAAGLNVCLTLQYGGGRGNTYVALGAFSLDETVLNELNYGKWIDRKVFSAVHEVEWNENHRIEGHPKFSFHKLKTRIEDYEPEEKYDLVYFDAFAPDVQPELWTETIFAKISGMMNPS